MFLIVSKIPKSNFDEYLFNKFINFNSKKSEVIRIVILSDFNINVKNNKVLVKIFKSINDIDSYEYIKKLYPKNRIIITEPYILINHNLLLLREDTKYVNNYLTVYNSLPIKYTHEEYYFDIEILLYKVSKEVVKSKIHVFNEKEKNINTDSVKLVAIVVCYNLTDILRKTYFENKKYLDNIILITDTSDFETIDFCKNNGLEFVSSNILDNNKLNKSRAINIGLKLMDEGNLILILDCDIIITNKIIPKNLEKKVLYTTKRRLCDSYNDYLEDRYTMIDEPNDLGFFQLFYNDGKRYINNNGGRFSDSKIWSDKLFSKEFRRIEQIKEEVYHIGYINKEWIEEPVLKKSYRKSNIVPKLAILTTFFNPRNYVNLRYNYLKFSQKIKEKADLFPIELSFTDDFFIEDDNVIKISGKDENILWQKERLLNIALSKIPKEYTNIAWIDCDVIFENEDWANEVNEKLNEYKVLHLFENFDRIGENNNIIESAKSIIKLIHEKNELINRLSEGKPGFAWAIRREVIDKIKFLDTQIIGGGDTLMFYSFISKYNDLKLLNKGWFSEFLEWYEKASAEIDKSVFFVKGNIKHLYHGKKINRSYNNRYEVLNNIEFTPKKDLILKNDLWEFKDKNNYKLLMQFFENRNEDDNIISFDDFDILYQESIEKDIINMYNKDYKIIKGFDNIIKDAISNNYNKIIIMYNNAYNKDLCVYIQDIRNKQWDMIKLTDALGNVLFFIDKSVFIECLNYENPISVMKRIKKEKRIYYINNFKKKINKNNENIYHN